MHYQLYNRKIRETQRLRERVKELEKRVEKLENKPNSMKPLDLNYEH